MENESNEPHETEKAPTIVAENEAKSMRATVELLKSMVLSVCDMPLWKITVLWKF